MRVLVVADSDRRPHLPGNDTYVFENMEKEATS